MQLSADSRLGLIEEKIGRGRGPFSGYPQIGLKSAFLFADSSNTMEKTFNTGAAIGIMGGALGSVIWLFITGLAINSPLFTFVPVSCGLFGGFLALFLLSRSPVKRSLIAGGIILWLAAVNFVFGNLVFDQIPVTVWGMPTGKEAFSRLHFNLLLLAMALFGFYLTVQTRLKRGQA